MPEDSCSDASNEFKAKFAHSMDLLVAEEEKIKNLPDNEYSDAYLSFRNLVEHVFHTLSVNHEQEMNSHWWSEADDRLTGFFGVEGIVIPHSKMSCNEQRRSFSLTVGPAPFYTMMQAIIDKAPAEIYETFTESCSVKNVEKLKKFATCVASAMSSMPLPLGMSTAAFLPAACALLDAISYTQIKQKVDQKLRFEAVQIKKCGAIIIASHKTSFDGRVNSGFFCTDQTVTMTTDIKIWKFVAMKDLKKAYRDILKQDAAQTPMTPIK